MDKYEAVSYRDKNIKSNVSINMTQINNDSKEYLNSTSV